MRNVSQFWIVHQSVCKREQPTIRRGRRIFAEFQAGGQI